MRVELPVCQTCNGTKQSAIPCPGYDSSFPNTSCTVAHFGPCPSCGGSGWNITDELVEVAASALYTARWGPSMSGAKPGNLDREHAVKVLVAVFDYLKKQQNA